MQAQSVPTAPGDLTATFVAGEGVVLSWNAPTEDASSVTGYQILRRLPDQGEPKPTVHVADTGSTDTTYTDSNTAVAGERYNYRVKALRGDVASKMSNLGSVTIPDAPPVNLTATFAEGKGVVLSWDPPAEEAESVTGYQILRRLPLHGEPRPTVYDADTGSTDTTYTDSDATVAGEQYSYRVKALRGDVASKMSNLGRVTIPQTDVTDATIKDLALSDADGTSIVLTPGFDPLLNSYEASVPNRVASITVSATKNYGGATLEFIDRPGAVQTGDTYEVEYSLDVGDNLVDIELNSANGNEEKSYTVTVTRAASTLTRSLSDDATLSSFELQDAKGAVIELTPEFDPATTVYSASVPNGVESVTLTTTKSHSGASVVVILPSEASEPDEATVDLAVGSNLIKAMVTAQDPNAVETYMVSVERAEPGEGVTKTLVRNTGQNNQLTYPFESFLSSLPSSVIQSFTTGLLDATVEAITLRLTSVGGSEIRVALHEADGNELGDLLGALVPPEKLKRKSTFIVAEDAPISLSPETTYYVKVDRVAGEFITSSTKANGEDADSAPGWDLGNEAWLWDEFMSEFVPYTLGRSLRIEISGYEETPVLPLLGVQNGSATEGSAVEFTVTLSKEAGDEVTVQYGTSDGTATSDVNDPDGPDYTPSSGQTLTLAPGETVKTVSIPTGDDTVDEDDETFTLTLSAPSQNAELGSDPSATGTIVNDDQTDLTDATLKELTLTDPNGGSIVLAPTFHPLVDTYQATVPNGVATISVAATKNYSGATLEFVDRVDSVQTGNTSEAGYNLGAGDNLVEIQMTSASGNVEKTYTLTVTRAASSDARLISFELQDQDGAVIELTPEFDPATTVYSVSVPNGVESVTLTTEKSHAGASVVVLSTSGTNQPDEATVDLAVGSNLIKAMVTAEDPNAVEIYMVSVERAEPEWSATLTVGTDETLAPIAAGYSRWKITGTELSTDEFTLDGTSYKVEFLFHLSEGLYFTLNKELPTDFTLRIGDYEYAGRDSLNGRGRWKGNYWWGDRAFSWTPGENVDVSLSMDRTALPSREHAPPSAYFSHLPPDGHNGVDSFQFRLNFTHPVQITDADLRDHALVVNGGSVSEVEALTNGRVWEITVEPDSVDDVTVSLHKAASCQELGAICGSGSEGLHNHPTLTVAGPGANPAS